MVLMATALALLLQAPIQTAAAADPTEVALARCLGGEDNGSTAGQTGCERDAARAYDRRMNLAYAALLRALPAEAASRLRRSQRAWIAFRDAETLARSALYETRTGTMYVPMQAGSETRVIRDRALQLEADLRILRIDD